MANRTIIIISDLHIGAGPLDDCDKELENHIITFLADLSSRTTPLELVINGDFLDFAQAPPWQDEDLESITKTGIPLCFTEEQSCAKMEAIAVEHHRIFEALGSYLKSGQENLLTILPGNHDADLFWDKVRQCFLDRTVGQHSSRVRIKFHLEQVYRPREYPDIWIEHGHQYDPCNAFKLDDGPIWSSDRPPILAGADNIRRLFECTGTRFLIRYLNRLDAEYPFVDNVKPFSYFIKTFGISALTPGYGPLKAAAATWSLLEYVCKTVTHRPSDLLGLDDPGLGPDRLLSEILNTMTDFERKTFTARIITRGFPIDEPITMFVANTSKAIMLMRFLSENLDLTENLGEKHPALLSVTGGQGTLTLAKGFSIDETQALQRAASSIFYSDKVNAVVMGHTHESVNTFLPGTYLNTGSWTRYYRSSHNSLLSSWRILRSSSYEIFPYELNYVEIRPESSVRMLRFRDRSS